MIAIICGVLGIAAGIYLGMTLVSFSIAYRLWKYATDEEVKEFWRIWNKKDEEA